MLLFGKDGGEGGRIGEDSGEDLRSIGGGLFFLLGVPILIFHV
jgi:hypothetical protein